MRLTKQFLLCVISLLLCQGCSIQKMRYSRGFNIHFESWGKHRGDKSTVRPRPKISHKSARLVDKTLETITHTMPAAITHEYPDSNSFIQVSDSPARMKFVSSPSKKTKTKIQSPKINPPKKIGNTSEETNVNALISFIVGLINLGISLFIFSNMILSAVILLPSLLFFITLVFAMTAIKQIKRGDGTGVGFAIFGMIFSFASVAMMSYLFFIIFLTFLLP
jgi:hypothetical protein